MSGGAPPASEVRAARELWLHLRSLAVRAPDSWAMCSLHYLLFCITAVLVDGFGLLAAATSGEPVDPTVVLGLGLVAVDSLWHASVLCSAGQRIASSVASGSKGILLRLPPRRAPQLQREVPRPGAARAQGQGRPTRTTRRYGGLAYAPVAPSSLSLSSLARLLL